MQQPLSFHDLHRGPGILILPNAWDAASARIFEDAGFAAIATSSAGCANALGYADGQAVPVDEHLAAIGRIVRVVRIPVTADVESGYGATPAAVADFIRRLTALGVAGYNLEDADGPRSLYNLDAAAQRIQAARSAAPALFLNARTDIFLLQIGDAADRLDRTIERLRAFVAAGADGVFVPGVADAATISALARAIDRPLNVLAGPKTPAAADLERLGVARVSVGSWPMRRTLGVVQDIAGQLRDGRFDFTRERCMPFDEANRLFADRAKSAV